MFLFVWFLFYNYVSAFAIYRPTFVGSNNTLLMAHRHTHWQPVITSEVRRKRHNRKTGELQHCFLRYFLQTAHQKGMRFRDSLAVYVPTHYMRHSRSVHANLAGTPVNGLLLNVNSNTHYYKHPCEENFCVQGKTWIYRPFWSIKA